MKNTFRRAYLAAFAGVASLSSFATAQAAKINLLSEKVGEGIETAPEGATINIQTDAWEQFGTMLNYLLTLVGLGVLVTLLYGGVTILTAGGDEEKVSTARKAITLGLAGAVLTALAYALNTWIFNSSFFVQ